MRGVLQNPRGHEVNASLQCSSSNAQSVSTHAKHNGTASSKKRKKSPETISSTARAVRARFYGKAITPETVAQASQLFPATEPPFTQKNTMFRANPNIQIASLIHENEAFVGGILQIPLVEEMKTKLSCEASFKFQELKK